MCTHACTGTGTHTNTHRKATRAHSLQFPRHICGPCCLLNVMGKKVAALFAQFQFQCRLCWYHCGDNAVFTGQVDMDVYCSWLLCHLMHLGHTSSIWLLSNYSSLCAPTKLEALYKVYKECLVLDLWTISREMFFCGEIMKVIKRQIIRLFFSGWRNWSLLCCC